MLSFEDTRTLRLENFVRYVIENVLLMVGDGGGTRC